MMSSVARPGIAVALACLLLLTWGCSKKVAPVGAAPSPSGQTASRGSAAGGAKALAPASPSWRPLALPSASASTSASPALVMHSYDAGTNACRLTYGPVRQPFLGEVALAPTDTGVLVVTHRDGVPTATAVVAPDGAATGVDLPPVPVGDAGLPVVTSPPCVVAGSFSLCMDPGGAIHRRSLDTEGRDLVVARARPGTGFAAELVAAAHVVVAYLAERRTSEGLTTEAYAVLDEGPPVRLSDEGSGTTHIALATRGASLLAFMVDGRTAMTPVHGRTIAVEGGRLTAGEDAVVFVGGGAEANTRGALGVSSSGAAFGLVPISGELGFGLVAVKLHDPPQMDEATTWSPYLNGLDPAPVAATRGASPIRVARVRPLEARADAPRGLELGKLDDGGAFVSYGLVGSRGRVRHVSLAVDRTGALWIAFTDGAGTWLQRRACP